MYAGIWGSAPNPGAASPKECCWGLRVTPTLGLRPRPRWGSVPNPVQEGVRGREPKRGLGLSPSGNILSAKPPPGLGEAPNAEAPTLATPDVERMFGYTNFFSQEVHSELHVLREFLSLKPFQNLLPQKAALRLVSRHCRTPNDFHLNS